MSESRPIDPNRNKPGFAELDALLDQALALNGAARQAFLAGLDDRQRQAVEKLLDKSGTDALARIGESSRERIAAVAEQDDRGTMAAGDWQLKREIGSGGTGQVFYAERRERAADGADEAGFVQRAAVKILWSHRVASQFRERFLRERRILASIDHPGLARFLDGGLLGDGRPWFAMEYIDGNDIVSYATTQPLAMRLQLFLAVIDTIEYAHQRLIVHRDIKPQNVLVDELGQPRVLDFGIARIIGEFDQQELTRAQGTPITLQYASPEQVLGSPIDVASDVYQLGLLLYLMLTGKPPYTVDAASLQEAIDTICTTTAPPASRHDPAIEADLDAILEQALHKQANQRYRSAADFGDDVRRYLDGRPVLARPQSSWYVASRFLRRNAVIVGVVSVATLALAGAALFSFKMALDARAEAERSQATQQILADVFQQADPFGEGGAEVSLADALIRAKPSIDASIADDPRLAWEVNRTLAGIFTSLDLLDLEKDSFAAAREAALALDGDNEAELLFAIAGLGNILARTDPAEAVSFLAEALPSQPASTAAASEWLSAKYAEVSAHQRLRDYERADAGARQMATVAADFAVDAPRTQGRISQLLAGAARRDGDIDAADAHWEAAIEHMRRAEQPDALAVTLSNMALHYGMTNRYERSNAAFLEATAIFREYAPDSTSHANVLRMYSGLLFRIDEPEQALAALDESVGILDPEKEDYSYFIAQLNRAGYAFAADNMATTVDAIDGGLTLALMTYGVDSAVTRRMLPVFGRLLQFADREADAARLLMVDADVLCDATPARTAALDTAIRELADSPAVAATRADLNDELDTLQQEATAGSLDNTAISAAFTRLRENPDVFLDALDRQRTLSAIASAAATADIELPVEMHAEIARMTAVRDAAIRLLAVDYGDRIESLLAAFQTPNRYACTES